MKQVDVAEAGSRLAEILAEAEHGEDAVLTRQGQPIGRLVPLGPAIHDFDARRRCDPKSWMPGLRRA